STDKSAMVLESGRRRQRGLYRQLAARNLLQCAQDLLVSAGLPNRLTRMGWCLCATPTGKLSTHFRARWESSLGWLVAGRGREGSDVDSLLRKTNLTAQQIEDPHARLSVESQIKFLDLNATTLDDESLGFHLAQKFDLRMGGLFYYVLASSETL